MTRRLRGAAAPFFALLALFARVAAAEETATGAKEESPVAAPEGEDPLERFRAPIDVLTERFVGTTSRAIRFDWRASPAQLGISGSELIERNNFGAARLGGFVRRPFQGIMAELAVHWVFAFPTESSDKLALTPYRQAGRPPRLEVDLNVGFPIAEGVVTPWTDWVPPAEMVLSVTGGLRYLLYFASFGGDEPLNIMRDLALPQLSARELERLEQDRLPGMEVDPARYTALVGLSLDVYFQPGLFLQPRAMLGLPVLGPVSATRLGLWWEMSLALGWAL